MARLEINTGIAPTGLGGDTPRSASIKINTMTQEIYQGLDATNKGGWGRADAIRLPDGTNMNNLPYINGIYTLTGTSNVNTPEGVQNGHIIVQCADIFVRQTFRQMASNVTWERAGQMGASWSAWARGAQVGSDLGNGIAGPNRFDGNVDTMAGIAPMGLSVYQLTDKTTGVLPPGFVGADAFNASLLEVTKWDSNWMMQKLLGGTGGTGGSLGGYFIRTITAGSFTNWQLIMNNGNAQNRVDAQNGRTGLLDDQVIGNWRVSRFANGFMSVSSSSGDPVAPDKKLAIGESQNIDFTLPIAFPDWGKTSVRVSYVPQASVDHYGIVVANMLSPTVGYATIRNGNTTAQTFSSGRVTVTGYWK
ncbi:MULTISPECIES: pyocin knob domain-containing protein [unclassified Pseudomonas]|uniref:pyocin knob domain-containing protein n=1 Tax=unclassified Pseudomonas TaxID=196821 RepID=UPI001F1B78F1|nr:MULTISPECIES: pyocin knob domain-containing protein [unclassified Pseudomonas]MCF5233103.1 hypothetical protein [Pseudomonas sp. PA-5-4H]MCF5237402.1 hypothetical protein [Pseudomonas sp. PA-5-4G]MCF5245984.1 hypothetical protein [Pseudomonas sp. PA-5-4B]MCF5252688.1 hypothetical protein [Pseudomonas sp. PA-5-4B]MCF5257965.1 hypothetical protein [Pseudomonas sp. PA-5-4A]